MGGTSEIMLRIIIPVENSRITKGTMIVRARALKFIPISRPAVADCNVLSLYRAPASDAALPLLLSSLFLSSLSGARSLCLNF